MQWYCEPFAGKKITVLGLGLLGRGVGDAEFLAKCGAEVLVTDKKDEAELAESVARLKKYPNVSFRLGGHAEEDFTGADIVVKAAGVPLDSPEVAAAQKAGASVVMSTALFAKYAVANPAASGGAEIVGVTGTRGKSTVTHMIFHALQKVGRRALLGGNIRGKSTLALLPDIRKGDICVLELDSWQLQGFGDMRISPHIAVFTNLYPDHQNYYHDMDEYFADKANIFRYQKGGDSLIASRGLTERLKAAQPPLPPLFPPPLPADWALKVPGKHNRENAALAAEALRALGVSEADIKSGLESFEGVEGRLQFVREVHGIGIYNDNNATTPEATIAALRALRDTEDKKGARIILIMGGADKGLDMSDLTDEVRKCCKAVVLLEGTGTDRIHAGLESALGNKIMIYHNLRDALGAAMEAAVRGDIVLFSPAFASFGMFKNVYDRNDQFLQVACSLS
ncbi:MAG: UDP-N-acetylmuramoyl-L-alanine--D-glutamate ligase [Patescibacteria group bacterium]|nr:UDP-N-acetylmuramoyl-L-alanine--D-glutamate ligase [Patescibacteria group bacterium]